MSTQLKKDAIKVLNWRIEQQGVTLLTAMENEFYSPDLEFDDMPQTSISTIQREMRAEKQLSIHRVYSDCGAVEITSLPDSPINTPENVIKAENYYRAHASGWHREQPCYTNDEGLPRGKHTNTSIWFCGENVTDNMVVVPGIENCYVREFVVSGMGESMINNIPLVVIDKMGLEKAKYQISLDGMIMKEECDAEHHLPFQKGDEYATHRIHNPAPRSNADPYLIQIADLAGVWHGIKGLTFGEEEISGSFKPDNTYDITSLPFATFADALDHFRENTFLKDMLNEAAREYNAVNSTDKVPNDLGTRLKDLVLGQFKEREAPQAQR